LAVLAVALIIAAFIKDYKDKGDVEIWKNTSSLKLFLVTLVMLIIYPYLLTYLGFATATFIFISIMIYSLFSKEERNIKKLGFISLIITIVIYLVFNEFINIPFPTGGLLI
jgi:drug/metabolite transporter (DMT)-like permease